MANQQHLDLLKQGAHAWRQWRKENPETNPDLSEANLSGMDLSGVALGVGLEPIRGKLQKDTAMAS